jgi:hypothetical protein
MRAGGSDGERRAGVRRVLASIVGFGLMWTRRVWVWLVQSVSCWPGQVRIVWVRRCGKVAEGCALFRRLGLVWREPPG